MSDFQLLETVSLLIFFIGINLISDGIAGKFDNNSSWLIIFLVSATNHFLNPMQQQVISAGVLFQLIYISSDFYFFLLNYQSFPPVLLFFSFFFLFSLSSSSKLFEKNSRDSVTLVCAFLVSSFKTIPLPGSLYSLNSSREFFFLVNSIYH